MNGVVSVTPKEGLPQYPFLGGGQGEVVVTVEDSRRGWAMADAMVDALGEHCYDANHEPVQDARFARLVMEIALYGAEDDKVILPRAGAVALSGALTEFAARYGEGRTDGLVTADFLAVAKQLAT